MASVTPRHADNTTTMRGCESCSSILATRSMHCASATLEPPNLWTCHWFITAGFRMDELATADTSGTIFLSKFTLSTRRAQDATLYWQEALRARLAAGNPP